ncbi:hypothetical protein E2C01_040842 [Portunus trituberculatus]|uniref:Uncharacterized protein n=1 Tax=Portunus trituberculatus TaxID=210409 RepID=A0A5B7FP25_PORTR|nr:hypothetical protein [Portunus trituberculatus]
MAVTPLGEHAFYHLRFPIFADSLLPSAKASGPGEEEKKYCSIFSTVNAAGFTFLEEKNVNLGAPNGASC